MQICAINSINCMPVVHNNPGQPKLPRTFLWGYLGSGALLLFISDTFRAIKIILLTAHLPSGLRRWFFKTVLPTPTRALPSSWKVIFSKAKQCITHLACLDTFKNHVVTNKSTTHLWWGPTVFPGWQVAPGDSPVTGVPLSYLSFKVKQLTQWKVNCSTRWFSCWKKSTSPDGSGQVFSKIFLWSVACS